MKKYKIKIKEIELNSKYLTITSTENKTFQTKIINGSINCRIINEERNEMFLSEINNDDLVTIYTKDAMIDKIVIKNKYIFISESSEELDI